MLRTLSIFPAFFLATMLVRSAEMPIQSIERIRSLPAEEAARNLPADIEALVTFRDPSALALVAFDGREGIYVELPAGTGRNISTGCRVRIEGVTQPGGFLPIVECRRITLLGREPLPAPRRIEPSELFSPALDCHWVEVPAIITGVQESKDVILVADVSGWRVNLLLPRDSHASQHIAALMQAPVTVRGVVGSVFNGQRQLTARHFFIPSFDHIVPSEDTAPAGEPRLRAVDELLRSDAAAHTRVRVRGVVTHAAGDGIYLRGEGGSLFVRAADPGGFVPGMSVEAEGFASVAPFRPILRATTVVSRGPATPPAPEPLALTSLALARQQAELVTVDADLLARRESPDGTVFQCRAGGWFFEALLPARTPLEARLRENDRLRLIGICDLTTTQALPFANNADGFRLHLRSSADIAILRRAPWWTLQRLLWALSAVGTLALVSLAWVALLRRRVSAQTRTIGAQLQRTAVLGERQRIARELHDTIEQELAGVSMQVRNARQRLAHAPGEAGASLQLAEKMLRHCREEARTSIRDLRSVALEQRGLRGAMEEFLTPLATEAGAPLTLEFHGEPFPLAGPVEVHLLRIAHEAASNAARHARASRIAVRLAYGSGCVTLEIADDGRGFDPDAPAPRGHFGILGIRERAGKIQAALTIESAPGAGTSIRVVVPASPASRAAEQLP